MAVTKEGSSGGSPMGARSIVAVALYLVLFSLLDLYGLVKIWPHPTPSGEPKTEAQSTASPAPAISPTPQITPQASPVQPTITPAPSPTTNPTLGRVERSTASSPTPVPPANGKNPLPEPEIISFFGGFLRVNVYAERRLLLLVILAGALGSLMHALRSLYWYTGNRMMMWSWVGFYLLLPFSGAILSVIFYFVVRGGFFSPQASFGDTSPFGFAALSALVGLFSSPATLKLKQIAETVFTKPEPGADTKPQESDDAGAGTPTPTISLVTPPSGTSAGAAKVTIAGTGFVEGLEVKFGGLPAEVTSSSSTSIEVVTPENVAGPASVDVVVTNPGGKAVTLSNGYTYLAGSGEAIPADEATTEQPEEGEGGDED